MPEVKHLGPPELDVAEDGYYVIAKGRVLAGPFEDEFGARLWLEARRRKRRWRAGEENLDRVASLVL